MSNRFQHRLSEVVFHNNMVPMKHMVGTMSTKSHRMTFQKSRLNSVSNGAATTIVEQSTIKPRLLASSIPGSPNMLD